MNVSNDKKDYADMILREYTPCYIGPGIVIEGNIKYKAAFSDERIVILGEVRGDIETNGIVQVVEGATLTAKDSIVCDQLIVAGVVNGESVKIKANTLLTQATGNIKVDLVCLPPGGQETQKGGRINARLEMQDDFSVDQAPMRPKELSRNLLATPPGVVNVVPGQPPARLQSAAADVSERNVSPLGGVRFSGADSAFIAPTKAVAHSPTST